VDDAVTGSGMFGNIPVDDCRPMFPMLVDYYLSRPVTHGSES
jgi:hypothetical protein